MCSLKGLHWFDLLFFLFGPEYGPNNNNKEDLLGALSPQRRAQSTLHLLTINGGGGGGEKIENTIIGDENICTMHDDENVTKQWLDLVGHEVTLEKMCFKRLLEHRSRNTRTIDPVSDTYLNVLLYLYTSFSWLLCLSAFLSSEMFFPL